jgi:hypothetical protein
VQQEPELFLLDIEATQSENGHHLGRDIIVCTATGGYVRSVESIQQASIVFLP